MRKEDIRKQVDRYLDGTTTAAEERQLRELLGRDDAVVPDEWKPLRALFRWESAERESQGGKPAGRNARPKMSRRLRRRLTAAVSVAAVFTLLVVSVARFQERNTDYAVIEGKKTTNQEIIEQEALSALALVGSNKEEDFGALLQMGGNKSEE